jgi:hypothetical protein
VVLLLAGEEEEEEEEEVVWEGVLEGGGVSRSGGSGIG